MKTIQLRGAALEAAAAVHRLSKAHDLAINELKARFQAELDAVCSKSRTDTDAQLRIIEQATGEGLRPRLDGGEAELDVRYVDLGLAFVNVQDQSDKHVILESQSLS